MDAPLSAWPGYSAKGTIVIPVDHARWAPPAVGVHVAGLQFTPKHELHVTIVGTALGARVRAALSERDVATQFERLDWSFQRTHRWLHIQRIVDGVVERALIERIEQPAMAEFHAALARLLDTTLPVPPPHVTLYVHGTDEGIGIPHEVALERWLVGEVSPTS